jgi:long-chain acyl-CoA synthetase
MPFILGKTITEIFLKRVAQTPEFIGFKYKTGKDWKNVSYREFYADVRSASYGLMAAGVVPGDRVAILSSTRYEWNVMDMAILGARAITVPVYPSNTAEDSAYILNHSEAKVLIAEDRSLMEKILSLRENDPGALPHLQRVVCIVSQDESQSLASLKRAGKTEEAKNPSLFDSNLEQAVPSDVLSIVYTSGTTGIPRGALITHDNMVSVLEDANAVLSGFMDSETETILSFLPTSHILGKWESMAGYSFGWTQAFAESLDKLLLNINEVRPTILISVPRTFEKAYSKIQSTVSHSSFMNKRLFAWAVKAGRNYYSAIWKKQLPKAVDFAEYMLAKQLVFSKVTKAFGGRLRYVVCGGAPLSRDLGEFFQIAGIKILEGYGLTETCGPISVNTPEDVRYGTVGRPLADVSVRIAADGEIEIHSRKVFAGYFKGPEETQAAFDGHGAERWFKTGDVGFIDDDGFIHVTDRKKDLIITSGGKNVAPQRIESLAKFNSWINQIVVIGDRRPYLVALITLNREEVIKAASEKGTLFSEYAELICNPKTIAMTQSMVDQVNSHLPKFETLKKFMILPGEFTVASGELTPSLKVKRKVVESRYKAEIETLYEQKVGPTL